MKHISYVVVVSLNKLALCFRQHIIFPPLLSSLLFVCFIMFSLGVKRKVHLRSSLSSSLLSEGVFIKRRQSFEIFTNVSVFLFSVAFPVLQAFSVHIAYWLAYIYSAPWHVLLPQQPATTPPSVLIFFPWLSPVYCPTMHCSLPSTSMWTVSAEGAADPSLWINFSKRRNTFFFFSAESFSFLDVYSNECWPEVTSCYARRPIHSSNTRLQKNKVHVGRGEHACDWRKGEGKKNSVMKGTNRNQAINMGIRLNVVNNPWTGFPSLFVTLECSDQKWQKCSTLSFFLSSCETFERVPVVSSPCLQPLTAYEYSLHLSS